MEKIASFAVDHDKIDVGVYISRVDGDITTYDIRMIRPNSGIYPSPAALHTIEHLFATFARNHAFGKNVVYIGPMGCRTGFYMLSRNLPHEDALTLIRESMNFISEFEGEIPGSSKAECGNYLDHDTDSAKKEIESLRKVLQNYNTDMLVYPA
ncbi:MAG: S-ribosylhomocysteine lyase [Oscillospiraceae bacterium]|nr:S-ribosylhomocysteine lyase [Oscillospiraceae bacterium]